MTGTAAQFPGLRFTTRHLVIVLAGFAILSAALYSERTRLAPLGFSAIVSDGLLLLPWVFGGLVALFDRPGPVRNWSVSCILALFLPALAIHHDSVAIHLWRTEGTVPNLPATVLYNIVFIGSFAAFWFCMRPLPCPGCSQPALIPLRRVVGWDKRTENTHWCASCGSQYWRHGWGPWHKERRRTWVNVAADAARPLASA